MFRSSLVFFLCLILTLSSSAQSQIDSLLLVLKTATDTNRVIALNKLSRQYLKKGDYDKVLSYSNEALALGERLNYKKGKARSLINAATAFLKTSDFEKAKDYNLQALDIGREIRDYQIIDFSTNNLGEVFRNQGNFEKALTYYLESLRATESLNDKGAESKTLNNIGIIHGRMSNSQKAIEYFDKALETNREINDSVGISSNLINLANMYYLLGDTEKGLSNYQQALDLKIKLKEHQGIANTLLGIGNIYLHKKELDKASNYYQKSLAEANIAGDKTSIASCYNCMSNVYYEQKEYNRAIDYQKKFLAIASEIGSMVQAYEAYGNLAELYSFVGDFKTAFHYQNRFIKLKDSLFSIERSKQIANMQAKYESDKKEKEIVSLKKEQALQLQINRNQKFLFVGIVILIFMAGLVFYFRAQVSRQKNFRLTEKIDSQNRELSTIAMLVAKKNQTLSELKERLSSPNLSPENNVNSILKDIGNEIAFDEEWATFKYHFEKVHPEFFTGLKRVASNLSVTELRLCAYLKSNLSTKEISQLTNTTVRSVQQAKYRINQKFKESGTNLSDHI